ncbi:MAG: energy transducer TonB [Steroidobacteraceae bacterium]|nr:energy transducer TonB [Steroidobacteraceae bacterium]
MRIDRYIHDERLTWGAGLVLLLVTTAHTAGIAGLLTARPPDTSSDAPPLFQVSLERLPPPPLPLPREEQAEPVGGVQDKVEQVPRKTRPVPILVDTPTTNPVPPDTQVKKYAMGDELLEGEPGPPSPPGAEVDGIGDQARDEPIVQSKVALRRMKPPIYPPRCLRSGAEGVVKVRVLVGEDGSPQEVTLAKSSGDSALDESALMAVRDWIFVPAMRNGLPVRSWAVVPIEFKIID